LPLHRKKGNPLGDKVMIIFDLDGTLHRTESALVPAIQRAMADLGHPPAEPEEINALYGEPLEVFCSRLLGRGGSTCSAFREGIRRHQQTTLRESGALYPGIAAMLEELGRMGLSLSICSNAGLDYIRLVTSCLGIEGFFDMLMGVEDGRPKSERVRDMISSSGSDFAVMVGDRYHDIRAARENGIPSIGCLYGYGSEKEMEAADHAVEDPSAIPSVVARILAERGLTPIPSP